MPAPQGTPTDATPTTGKRRTPWLDGVLVFLVLLVAGGDAPPHRNEAHYLTRLKHYWDPEWCSGDLFLESPDAHFTVVWLFGWVTRFLTLDTTAWIGRAISWALLAYAWTGLCRRVAPGRWIAPLTAGLLVTLTEETHFAGEWIVGGFEAKCVSYGFVVLALNAWLDDRWNRAWTLLGVASAFHALVGGWSVVALSFAWLTECGRRPSLPSMIPGLAVGGSVALCGVVPALSLNQGEPAETVAEAQQIYVFTRLPHHLAPLSNPLPWLVERTTRCLIGLALFVGLTQSILRNGGHSREGFRRLTAFACGSLAISSAGLVVEIVLWSDPSNAARILRYYLFRLGDIAPAMVSALTLGALVAGRATTGGSSGRLLIVACVAVSVWGVGRHVAVTPSSLDAPADAKMRDAASWVAICEWIAVNTADDALFLVPRSSHTFKWRTGRAEVVTYKDVPQNAAGLVEWRDRFYDVFRIGERADGRPKWTRSLASLGATRLGELARKYGADYALDQSPRDRPWVRASLPVVHRVGPYRLYDLRGQHARETRP